VPVGGTSFFVVAAAAVVDYGVVAVVVVAVAPYVVVLSNLWIATKWWQAFLQPRIASVLFRRRHGTVVAVGS